MKDSLKIILVFVALFFLILIALLIWDRLTPKDNGTLKNANQQSTAAATNNSLKANQQSAPKETIQPQTAKCISIARGFGYSDGRCAYSFIQACLTGSRENLESTWRADKALGMVGPSQMGGSCPNMPDTYVKEYDRL